MNPVRDTTIVAPEFERSSWKTQLGEQLRLLLGVPYKDIQGTIERTCSFLESEFGFQKGEIKTDSLGTKGNWTRGDLSVTVDVGIRESTMVALSLLTKENGCFSFDLRHIILYLENHTLSELKPSERIKIMREMGRGSTEDVLERNAMWLRNYADRVLSGDPELFQAMRREQTMIVQQRN